MTTETGINRRGSFVASIWPWLTGAGMLVIYLCTLHHSATPTSLDRLVEFSGWNWRPRVFGPVTFLITYPLHWLPPAAMVLWMNLFNAVCAALVLVLLARSVALLPHDRTNEQRQREQSESSMLSIRSAWLPPLLAVLVCGLQLTFWENAVEFRQLSIIDGGEMLNLLMFAYLVRCLLEFRLSQRESWLSRFALVLGLAMANNWFMFVLFPGFVIALVWIKGFEFFNWRFLLRALLWGLAGLSLILLFPLVHGISLSPHFPVFKYTLHFLLSSDKSQVLLFLHPQPSRLLLILVAVSSVVPVLLISIRWASSFGDSTPIGVFLATSAFNIMHGFFLLCCVWAALDSPFGPRQLLSETAFSGVPFLGLYYLGALSIGYFCGYFLLVFGPRPVKPRQRPNPLVQWFDRGVIAAVWLLALAVPAALAARNLGLLQKSSATDGLMDRYFARTEHALPPQGGVLLSDDAFLLHKLQSTLVRDGNKADYLMIDTSAMRQTWSYVEFLMKRHPEFDLPAALTNVAPNQPMADEECIHMLERLGTNHAIYYLHPSYGYYFERFYARPHGLVWELQICPTNEWLPPAPTAGELAENGTFWKEAGDDLNGLLHAMEPPPRYDNPNPWQWFQKTARLATDPDRLAVMMGGYYSRALNCRGVDLAIAGFPADAGKCYELASRLNPGNASARINLKFNQSVLAGVKPVLKTPRAFEAETGDYRQWVQLVSGGPVDEPSFCGAMGAVAYLPGKNYRQAIMQLERERALMPEDLNPLVQLAQAFLYIQVHPNPISYAYPPPSQTGSNALAVADDAVRLAPNNPTALYLKAGALMQLGQFEQSIPLFDGVLAIQSTNHQVRYFRGVAEMQSEKLGEAKQDFEFLAKALPDSSQIYMVYYYLGEIAYKQKDNESATKYYELCLAKAPASVANSPAAEPVRKRLEELKAGK